MCVCRKAYIRTIHSYPWQEFFYYKMCFCVAEKLIIFRQSFRRLLSHGVFGVFVGDITIMCPLISTISYSSPIKGAIARSLK